MWTEDLVDVFLVAHSSSEESSPIRAPLATRLIPGHTRTHATYTPVSSEALCAQYDMTRANSCVCVCVYVCVCVCAGAVAQSHDHIHTHTHIHTTFALTDSLSHTTASLPPSRGIQKTSTKLAFRLSGRWCSDHALMTCPCTRSRTYSSHRYQTHVIKRMASNARTPRAQERKTESVTCHTRVETLPREISSRRRSTSCSLRSSFPYVVGEERKRTPRVREQVGWAREPVLQQKDLDKASTRGERLPGRAEGLSLTRLLLRTQRREEKGHRVDH
jgi:hypothetical protein